MSNLVEPSDTAIRHTVDAVAAMNVVAIVAGWLPVIAVLLSIGWYAFQMLDLYQRRKKRGPYKG